MTSLVSLKALAARAAALRQAMDAVRQDPTPSQGKWAGANHFVRTYCDLANQYVSLTGDRSLRVYDVSNLRGWADTVWPQQKELFDIIYTDTLTLLGMVNQHDVVPPGPLYNLFVSGSSEDWKGAPFQIELSRCVREYTAPNLTARYGGLDAIAVAELRRAPCIFAYERGHKIQPGFGYIRDIVQRQGQVRVEYDLQDIVPFLSADELEQFSFELDIGKNEMYRTHWALKEVNLPKELHVKGITIPSLRRDVVNAVDVSIHTFEIALSFPGEVRPLVEQVAHELERRLGPNTYFYDNNYLSQLAQPSLDTLLQGVYGRAKLVVAFLSADYQRKDWCGVEFRAIKEIIFKREHRRVMFVRTGAGEVDGVFRTDGYIDAEKVSSGQIAQFICERLMLLTSGTGPMAS